VREDPSPLEFVCLPDDRTADRAERNAQFDAPSPCVGSWTGLVKNARSKTVIPAPERITLQPGFRPDGIPSQAIDNLIRRPD
jgi:hypothetical protein